MQKSAIQMHIVRGLIIERETVRRPIRAEPRVRVAHAAAAGSTHAIEKYGCCVVVIQIAVQIAVKATGDVQGYIYIRQIAGERVDRQGILVAIKIVVGNWSEQII